MPIENQDDIWFKDIMTVNFAIEQSPTPYELTSAQEDTLLTIANTPYSIMRGYACSLLSLCKGYSCEDTSYLVSLRNDLKRNQYASIPNSKARLYPNPATSNVMIEYQDKIGEVLSIEILNNVYQPVKSLHIINSGAYSLETSNLPEGVYIVRLIDNSGILFSGKLIVIH